ncbi:MAG: polysulfide reductase NrfD [Lentimicrobiaceae bacterium]|jgi:molybdopterin-containing oxidoreductase family membrane subunit|nr:polysulfide reductase NrfD [Lentimicrobiaceae bacterium]MDD4596989.1 polysulfide reductase NrfD [Lentimicrobiaceae bacterium]MDY0026703.1 NrfD/PsrC family molybdoenzyme membrane anchor subunit [Lentimicrobium sp.]HAH58752.1 hydrogenase [Bacteroidales bacterium]
MYKTEVRGPLILGDKNYHQISTDIIAPINQPVPLWWKVAFGISNLALLFGLVAIYQTVSVGIGTWGVNNSVGWAWEIINFVWWIGIGHAGTAFSIFLLVLRQKWRTSINRAAEAMTVVAVMCAAIFPALHMGRVWLAFYIFPYPNTRGPLWVNYNSPLFWDFIAISAYLLISASFWYFGMVPDFATIRDRTTSKIKKAVYGFFAFGWVGTSREWLRFEALSYVLGGIAAVLVVSVHSIVSTDFAVSVIPGWHTTVFPPYFVVGAIFSGFAMVMTLMIIIRKMYKFQDYVTSSHLNAIAKILIFISLIMGTAYATEAFIAWYSGNRYEIFTFFYNRATGDYSIEYWTMIICNAIVPQLFWFKKIRKNLTAAFIISIIINIGMWFERYNIIITSLAKDFLPSSWVTYSPTWVEIGVFVGTLGLFGAGVLLFFKFIPMMAISELKGILKVTSYNTNDKKHISHE